jgi:hypothetical protein
MKTSETLKAQAGPFNAKTLYVNQNHIRILRYSLSSVALLAGLALMLAPAVQARNKAPNAAPPGPNDEIQVVGHVPLTDGSVARFLATQHYSFYYLYAEREAGKSVTLIDVTNVSKPSVLANVPYSSGGSDSLAAVAGTAALITSAPAAPASAAAAQTIRIMDFSDPRNPRVAREFTGVTAMSRDDRRGLIFVANTEGIWILRQHLAQDPEVEKAYANYVLYSH